MFLSMKHRFIVILLILCFILAIIFFSSISVEENDTNISIQGNDTNTSVYFGSCEEKITQHCDALYLPADTSGYLRCIDAGRNLGACPDGPPGHTTPTLSTTMETLPKHTVLDKINLIKGGVYVEILLEDQSLPITKEDFRILAHSFLEIEQAEYGFYLTKEAVEADYSSIFAEQNPNALREGALGYIENGTVVFGPYFD